jgi:YidC/Oxa1 family membrane protein insertase
MDGQNNKNTMLAITLSVMVLIAWQFFYVSPKVEAERRAAEIQAQLDQTKVNQGTETSSTVTNELPSTNTQSPSQGTVSAEVPGATATTREVAIANSARISFENAHLTGSINLKAARIDDLSLKDYHVTIDKKSPLVTLLSPSEAPEGYFAEFGFLGSASSGDVPGPTTEWKNVGPSSLTPETPLVLEWTNSRNVKFTRTIKLDNTFLFTFSDEVSNGSGQAISLSSYGRITRFGTPMIANIFVLHEGMIGFFGEQGLQEVDYKDIRKELVINDAKTDSGWLGITDKYWATALAPTNPFTPRFAYFADGRERYQSDFLGEPLSIEAGASTTVENKLFSGAKKEEIIESYTLPDGGIFNALGGLLNSGEVYNTNPDNQFSNFDLVIDWGWFYFFTKPLFKLMNWLYHLIGNFGVAILVTTVIIKTILFPLANMSYASMAKMKKVQPEMAKLKERAGDDRAKLQQDMMALYKKEKINPAAGCWPMLVQIPIFFALYKVIYVTIEMRHAPFFGWIQDLSAPDPTSMFNLFGLLPYDVPHFLLIGVWPLLMGITMFLQMQMNPTPPDPTQAMIFKWMPIVFTFMLATFPAGLVIYWAWNNFLSIVQQGTIMKKNGVKIELWDNLKSMFPRKPKDTPAK